MTKFDPNRDDNGSYFVTRDVIHMTHQSIDLRDLWPTTRD